MPLVMENPEPAFASPPARLSKSTSDFLGDGDRAQAIIAVNQKLKQLGIDQTISLPQLCVIGDQSAGKSSLIEAISDIQVPKSDGTCTRCPVAINLGSGPSDDSPWSCRISIEERYDYVIGKPVTADNPLGPWQKRADMKTIVLGTITDKSRIPQMITEAQNQVLKVTHSHTTRSQTPTTTKFSPNIIRLDITEGIRPNLCFIDLPGVISNVARREDHYLIELVANLVKKYAKDPRNENILTLPMTADVQTSNTCSIVQELQVEDRTLAVFTKPDRVKEDQQQNFVSQYLTKTISNGQVANDEVTRFENGCHFVMLANSLGQNLALSDAEAKFFQQSIWAKLNGNFRQRLGVPALCEYLREQLFHKTCEALPKNLESIEEELKRIDESLKLLPQPPDKVEFRIKMQQILQDFSKAMTERFLGDSEQTIKGALRTSKFENFKTLVNKAVPIIDYASRSERKQMQNRISDIDDLLKEKKNVKEQDCREWETEKTTGKHFRLENLQKINRGFHHSGLPGNVDARAEEKACKDATGCWHDLFNQFMHGIHEYMETNTMEVFTRVFEPYQNLGIQPVVKSWIITNLKKAVDSERQIAGTSSLAELSTPFTMNDEDLEEIFNVKLADLAAQRLNFRVELEKKVRDVDEGIYKRDRKDVTKETIGRDEFKSEIVLGAKIQAYYEIASKRFIDTVCQGIYSRVLPYCGEELAAGLKVYIGPSDASNEDRITKWLIEDPEKENSRRRLINKRQQLCEGRLYIESVLGGTASSVSAMSPSKRTCSPTITIPGTPDAHSKKQKVRHGSLDADPKTPRSQMTQQLGGLEIASENGSQ